MKLTIKHLLIVLGATAAVTVGASVLAATSAELRVTGSITPPPCSIVLDGDGNLNFGSQAFSTLAADGTRFAERTIGVNITCEGPARVGLRVVDNRASSKVAKASLAATAWPNNATTLGDQYVYGLGTTANGTANIGGVMFGFQGGVVTTDGTANSHVIYSADRSSWQFDPIARAYMTPDMTYAFVRGAATTDNSTPTTITTVRGNLVVVPTINRNSALPAGHIIELDGSATLTLMYL